MRIVEKLLYGICGVIGLLLLFILLCHLNPSLANGFAKDEQKVEIPAYESDREENVIATLNPTEDLDATTPNIENKEIENNVLGSSIYEVPDVSALEIPNNMLGLMGMEVPEGKVTEVSEKRAEEIKRDLTIGESGEEFTYDKKFYPYYYMLDETEQTLYKQIHANSQNLLEKFAPVKEEASQKQLKNAFTALVNDHPELFWMNTGYGYYVDPAKKIIEIDLLYNFTAKDLDSYKTRFEEAANDIVYGCRGAGDTYKQEVYVHDTLCERIKYDLNAPANQSAYSALVTNRTVCAGYARAFQYIMQKLNIPCYYCAGYAGENHAWNIINLDKDYYNVDITWDDQNPKIYDFFNCSDDEYKSNHIRRDLSVNLPACLGTKYSNLEKNKVIEEQKPETIEKEKENNNNTKEPEKAEAVVEKNDIPVTSSVTETTTTTTVERVLYENPKEYYVECAHQIMEAKGNNITFTLYLEDEDLWDELREQYLDGTYQDAYLGRILAEKHAKGATTSVTGEILSDGTVKVVHSIQIY